MSRTKETVFAISVYGPRLTSANFRPTKDQAHHNHATLHFDM